MPAVRSLALLAALILLPTLGYSQTPPDKSLVEVQNQAVFCEGIYALCIKAPCVPIPRMDRLGNYTLDTAACSCAVVAGWSMGPGQCADRAPVTQNGRTYLISTYSNHFNVGKNSINTTLACNTSTPWAWCYGAPCVIDENSPEKMATCTCPLQTGPMQTIGGDCQPDRCKFIWSGATPTADNAANKLYAAFMAKNGYPHQLPSQLCEPPSK